MKKYTLPLLATLVLSLYACSRVEPLPEDSSYKRRLELLAHAQTQTDKWIEQNIREKYNIDPIWHWTDRETDYGKNLVPPLEKNVIPFLKVIDRAFLDVYATVRGKDFINTYVPKQFLLIGSHSYNVSDGTITLGQAEGGRKIYFYGVNHFLQPGRIERNLHTMYHEFSHILHQTKLYSEEYEKITPEGYTAQWHNASLKEALEKGFISSYAMANKNEDFVEMIAFYVTLSPQQWEERLESIDGSYTADKAREAAKQEGKSKEEQQRIYEAVATSTVQQAKAAIEKKLGLVKEYLKINWEIELDSLRALAQERILEVLSNARPTGTIATMRQSPFLEEAHYCNCGENHK